MSVYTIIDYNDVCLLPAKEPTPITVTLPEGKEVKGQAWRTTPHSIAQDISQGLADNVVIAKVTELLHYPRRSLSAAVSLVPSQGRVFQTHP